MNKQNKFTTLEQGAPKAAQQGAYDFRLKDSFQFSLLKTLRRIKYLATQDHTKLSHGICGAVYTAFRYTDNRFINVPLAEAWLDSKFITWPKFSGDLPFPVPHPTIRPEDAYCETFGSIGSSTGWRFDQSTEYGRNRMDLLNHLIKQAEADVAGARLLSVLVGIRRKLDAGYVPSGGICSEVANPFHAYSDVVGNTLKILRDTFETWEHFSGSWAYPIGEDRKAASDSFNFTAKNLFWIKSTEYGRLRHDLLDHCINTLAERVVVV